MDHLTESNAQRGQQQAQQQYTDQVTRRRGGIVGHRKGGGGQPHTAADPHADQRRDQAGQQRCVLHGADVDDFQRKYGSGQRRTKYSGKRPRHAAHGHQAAVPGLQLQSPADLPGQ